MAKQNLGMVTAYAYAVVGGYEGTEAEFEALLGNIATDLAEIENLTVIANTLPSGSSATASYDHGVLTLGIPKGDKGDTGAGATVTAGTTATGDPGTNASVTNSGTTKDAVFNFTIPRGDTGNGIESIYLTGTSGAVKTYTILFTDGNTTNFDVTDGEVTNATLTAVLADYAKIDGAYESMTVGNAEQLVSTVFVNDEEPYNFRTSGGSADVGDREYDTIVGGTVAWNQLAQAINSTNYRNQYATCSYNNGVVSVSDPTARYSGIRGNTMATKPSAGHKLLLSYDVKTNWAGTSPAIYYNNGYWQGGKSKAVSADTWTNISTIINVVRGSANTDSINLQDDNAEFSGHAFEAKNMMAIDLTQMFGSTIADYIYSLETANAGAGVAWFKKLFPKPYYAYNAVELMSVNTSAHNTVGFNSWDTSTDNVGKVIANNGTLLNNDSYSTSDYIKVVAGATYYFKDVAPNTNANTIAEYDADKIFIRTQSISGTSGTNTSGTKAMSDNTHYIRVARFNTSTEPCINLSWDGERDGEYEPYVKHSYPLDSGLTLRGIPKLDASNNLYYDGDVYESDGTVTRRYGIVDLGTLNWNRNATNQYYAALPTAGTQYTGNHICTKYTASARGAYDGNADKAISITGGNVWVRDTAYPSATGTEFKTAMSGVYLVYELATPTTETADPFQSPQIVDDFGTEEYVDYAVSQGDRDVAIPVGHETQYMANLKAKLEMAPNSPEGAGDYLVRQTNGINEYVSLSSNATIQDMLARIEALEGGGE